MKITVVFCMLLVGVVTVVSQVAEQPDASPFQHLLTKELGRMAKNIRKQLHSEMAELVEELRQKFLQTTIHFEASSENTNVEIHENMMKEKNILENRFMKVVNYTSNQMEELSNYLHYLELAIKGDINPYDFQMLVSEASMLERNKKEALTLQSSDTYINDDNILLYTEESASYLDVGSPDSTTPAYAAAAMRPQDLVMTLDISRPRSCYELYQNGSTQNGIYIIYPEGPGGMGIKVWCVMALDEGGWTVILARLPDVEHVEFSRPVHDYVIGFGQPDGHYWMGLRHVESMCGLAAQELKVYMQDWDGSLALADYDNFSINHTDESWYLQISGFHTASKAGDALSSQNGAMFKHTPELGGWWHSQEGGATPTGKYYTQGFVPQGREAGVEWPTWKGHKTSLKKLLIMIRSKN